MNFTLNRDYTLASVLGHAIEFKKGVPTHVPPLLHKEAVAIGAEPEEELAVEPEMTIEEREAVILEAVKKIYERDAREEFTAANVPRPQVISRDVGFYVSGKERDKAVAAMKGGDD